MFQNECVRKRCAISQVNVDGRCLTIVSHISDISFDFRLNVIYQARKLPSKESIIDHVRAVALTENDSEFCLERTLGLETRGNHVVYHIQLVKKVAELRDIKADFLNVKRNIKLLNIEAAEKLLGFEIEFSNSPIRSVKDGIVSLTAFNDFGTSMECGYHIAMSPLQFCDTVLFYNFAPGFSGTVIVGDYSFMPGEYITASDSGYDNQSAMFDKIKSISVCYDLYKSRKLEGNVTTVFNGEKRNCLFNIWLHMYIVFCYIFGLVN